ncbi:MAG: flagellar export protein FliJ [Desulfobacterales bacterium]
MFVFRFEAVLRARSHAEEIRRKALLEAEQGLAACREALREIRRKRHHTWIELETAKRSGFRAEQIALHLAFLERLEQDLRGKAGELAAAEQKVRRCRRELLEAVKARRMLEKLREKDEAAWKAALDARERSFLDEVASRRTPGRL